MCDRAVLVRHGLPYPLVCPWTVVDSVRAREHRVLFGHVKSVASVVSASAAFTSAVWRVAAATVWETRAGRDTFLVCAVSRVILDKGVCRVPPCPTLGREFQT